MTAMTLIEGVGDEVTAFFLLTVLGVLAVLAWWTTQVVDRPLRIQTIIVGQRVIHVQGEQAGAEPAGEEASDPTGDSGASGGDDGATAQAEDECDDDNTGTGDSVTGDSARVTGDSAPAETAPVVEAAAASPAETSSAPVAVAEQESAGASPPEEADPAACPPFDQVVDQEIRQRRLAHFQRLADGTGAVPDPADRSAGAREGSSTSGESAAMSSAAEGSSRFSEPTAAGATSELATSAPGSEEVDSVTSELATTAPGSEEVNSATASEVDRRSSDGRSIMVKLKFLNDTQRLVEGSRQEALADFKRRHFPAETAANRLVRLIFNGRLLPDQETLAQCGFYHNCVVHCHVSAEPRPPPSAAAAAAGRTGTADEQPDLGVLMLPALTSVLTLVWGLRLRYPEMFSSLASGLLVVLTLLLAVFAAGAFLPLQRLTAAVAQHRQQRRGR